MAGSAALGLSIPNVLPDSILGARLDWLQPAGRLIWSTLLAVVALAVVFAITRRPKSPEPVTWAAAMAGATAVFAWMLLAYGVVPHEWLTFANSYLNWGKDSFLVQDSSILPFDITKAVVAETIEVGIYVVFAVANVTLIVLWQKRPERVPDEAETAAEREPSGTSAYGRPVTTAS